MAPCRTGFCFFNSVAVAAKHAIATGRATRVVILDWDVHHGNGTQDLTYDDPNIVYISLHRYATGSGYFFPSTGPSAEVGVAEAAGTNVNIAWTNGGMGNVEYAAAFCELILPLVSDFDPNLILISSGFDAADGDLLGDCKLTPDMYHMMTRSLIEVAAPGVPIVVALEGGYNIDVISTCMEAVAVALLDEKWQDDNDHDPLKTPLNEYPELASTSSELSDDTKICSGSLNYKGSRLQKGRQILSKYWKYDEEKKQDRGFLKPGAVRCINNTIRALESSSRWSPIFRKVEGGKAPVQNLQGVKTMRTRSERKREEKEETNELDSLFESLAL